MDVIKWFDMFWLEACMNSLYDAGIKDDILKKMYIENQYAQIAIKVNNIVSNRILVTSVVMQGSVWGNLKCTSQMDTLNKAITDVDNLMYKYKGNKNIPIWD